MHPQLTMLGVRFLVWAASLSLPNDGALPANQQSAAWHNSIPETERHDALHGFTPMNLWTNPPHEKRPFDTVRDTWLTNSMGGNTQAGSGSGGGSDAGLFAWHSNSASHTKAGDSHAASSHSAMNDDLRKKLLTSDTPWGPKSYHHDDDPNDPGRGKNIGDTGHPSVNDFSVPEPASLIVWSLLGTFGLTLCWWRKRTR
jgi:hypothetical protein